jgi:hypothetical protein
VRPDPAQRRQPCFSDLEDLSLRFQLASGEAIWLGRNSLDVTQRCDREVQRSVNVELEPFFPSSVAVDAGFSGGCPNGFNGEALALRSAGDCRCGSEKHGAAVQVAGIGHSAPGESQSCVCSGSITHFLELVERNAEPLVIGSSSRPRDHGGLPVTPCHSPKVPDRTGDVVRFGDAPVRLVEVATLTGQLG